MAVRFANSAGCLLKQSVSEALKGLESLNTFNVGVLGSSPRRITRGSRFSHEIVAFFHARKRLSTSS